MGILLEFRTGRVLLRERLPRAFQLRAFIRNLGVALRCHFPGGRPRPLCDFCHGPQLLRNDPIKSRFFCCFLGRQMGVSDKREPLPLTAQLRNYSSILGPVECPPGRVKRGLL